MPLLRHAISDAWERHGFEEGVRKVVVPTLRELMRYWNSSPLAQIATARILGRISAGTGDVEALTGTQATTLLDVFTSALKGLAPASGGGTVNYLRADGTWSPPFGATEEYTSYDPVGWPTSIHASSDDFFDAAASALKWTLVHPGANGSLTFDEDFKRMILEATGTGADSAVFAIQAAPSTQFTVVGYVAIETPTIIGNPASAGIFVAEDDDLSTADFYTTKHDQSTTLAEIVVQSWQDYNGTVTSHVRHARYAGGAYWFRIRVNGADVSTDISYQDTPIAWVNVDNRTLAYTPAYMGVIANTTKANPNVARAICTDFLVFNAVSAFDSVPKIGRRVRIHGEIL